MDTREIKTKPVDGAELSISIVTYQIEHGTFTSVLASLNKAVEYLFRQKKLLVNVQIIDNGKQEELLKDIIRLAQRPSIQYELISNKSNIGFGCAHNLSIANSTSRFHLILNPDVILTKDSLCEGIRYLIENKEVSAVTPHAIEEDGKTQYLCKRYPSVFKLLLRGFAPAYIKKMFESHLNNYEMRDESRDKIIRDIPLISGCFMLCDREKLQEAGGFNKKYFLYFEDFALSKELSELGSLVYLPAMRIHHFGGNSAKKGVKHIFMFMRSAVIFFNSYGWKIF